MAAGAPVPGRVGDLSSDSEGHGSGCLEVCHGQGWQGLGPGLQTSREGANGGP